MKIVINNIVISAPVVQARITESGVITGAFNEAEARVLAAQLRYGALPFSFTVESFEAFTEDN
jgi:preprotein translocase subunit SecD